MIGGKRAVDFYTRAFGAEETYRNTADDGERLLHARMRLNGGWIMLSDHFEEMAKAPAPKPAAVMMHLQVDDADRWWDRAVAAGATVKFPLADQFWGDRFGVLDDPFGHSWSIGGPIKS